MKETPSSTVFEGFQAISAILLQDWLSGTHRKYVSETLKSM